MLPCLVSASNKHEKMRKKSYKGNKCEILATMWYEKVELSDGSYNVSGIQDYLSTS